VAEAADQGRRLEQGVAAFFQSHGYQARCNVVLEGRSGGRHEVDVLAEKSDALTTFRTAIECKAWQQPIEKDVVSKLAYVIGDLGLNKGIIVSLAGCRSGAQTAATELGVELWGPDELRRHLGDTEVAALQVPASAVSATLVWGLSFAIGPQDAERTIRSEGKGRRGRRSVEQLAYLAPMWLPAYCVRVTIARPEEEQRGILRSRAMVVHRSISIDNLYEALGGSYLGPVRRPWEQLQIARGAALSPAYRDTKVHAGLRKAFASYDRVTTASAVECHAATLYGLGVPTPCSSFSIDSTALVHLPFYIGILDTQGRQRVVAVDGHSGECSEHASQLLTTSLPQLRAHLAGSRR
jgi:hypothetical protein